MNDFIFHNPDKVYFGKNQMGHLPEELLKFGNKVLLVYGGGSTIDCAKGVAAAALTEDGDVWPLVSGGTWVMEALPVIAVLTNAATGSEMDAWAVISNMDTNEKIGLGGDALIPRVAFENPEYSYSLPVYQTACGAFDIFNHVLDNYYLAGDATFDMALNSILDVGTVHGLSNIPFCSFKKRYGCFPVSISLFVVKVNGTGKMYS